MPKPKTSSKKVYDQHFGSLSESECIQRLMFTEQFPSCKGKKPKYWDPRYISARERRFVANPNFWTKRALAIFEVEGNVARAAMNFSLAIRNIAWDLGGKDRTEACSYPRNILEAMAVHDVDLIAKLAGPAIKGNSIPARYLVPTSAIRAALRGGLDAMRDVFNNSPKFTPWFGEQGTWYTLLAIANGDLPSFESGIELAAKEAKSKPHRDLDLEGRQVLFVGGLLRLANEVNPSLLNRFQWKSVEPWYRDLFEWTQTNVLDLSMLDLRKLSVDLHNVWIELKRPHWSSYRPTGSDSGMSTPVLGIPKTQWEAICKKDSYIASCAVGEIKYHRVLCEHYGLPYRDPFIGQLIPSSLASKAKGLEEQFEARELKNARRFENNRDYYIINVHKRCVYSYSAALGCLGREDLATFETGKAAKAFAELKIKSLVKQGFKEVPLVTTEFDEADESESRGEAITIGFSQADQKDLDDRFVSRWKDKLASRETAKASRTKAKLKTKLAPKPKGIKRAIGATKKKTVKIAKKGKNSTSKRK